MLEIFIKHLITMDLLESILSILLHLDEYLISVVNTYQEWTYLLLFLIVFFESGLIVAAFLPGDALLFTTGTVAAVGGLNIWVLLVLLFVAASLGGALNYMIGKKLGVRVLELDSRIIKRKHLTQTQVFYNKHGGKTIIIARFMPILRSFAPFIAGVSIMKYSKFMSYNIIGAFIWIFSCVLLGYFFGNLPFVKTNFSLIILGIVIISTSPVIINYIIILFKKNAN